MSSFVRAFAPFVLLIAACLAAPAQEQQPPPQPAQPQATQPPQAAQTPQPGAPASAAAADGKAVVFIYRPGKLVGKALEPSVYCDGVEVGRMDNGRYIVLLLEPGEHRIHTTEEYKRVDLKLGAGQVAFVRVKIEMGMMKGRGNVYLADEEDAAKTLKKSKPLGADKFKDNKLAVVDKGEAEALLARYVH